MATLLIVVATFLLMWLIKRAWSGRRNKFVYPPGPPGLPFIGNALQFGNMAPHIKHQEFSKKYGDIHTVTMFGQKSVVLSSMDAVKQCHFDRSDDFNHRPIWLECLCNIAPGIAFRGADQYKENRRFVLRNLKDHGMGRSELEPKILNEIDNVLTILEEAENRTIEPHDLMETFAANVISQLCFTKSWEHHGKDARLLKTYLKGINESTDAITMCDFMPVLKYLPAMKKTYQEFIRNVQCIQSIGKTAIMDRQTDNQTYGEDECITYESMDLVDDFLLACKNNPSNAETHNFMQISHDLFEAGTHTSATTITFAMIQLINKPDLQEQLYTEIVNCLGERINPDMGDMKSMPRMEALIQEILRMYAIVPLIFHATYRDSTLRQYIIPKNTMVLINAHCINHDEKVFRYPMEFNPSRWINDNGKFKSEDRDSIITFGMGRRECLGKSLARMEIFLFLVKMINKYKLEVPAGSKLPNCEPIMNRASITMEHFSLRVVPREQGRK